MPRIGSNSPKTHTPSVQPKQTQQPKEIAQPKQTVQSKPAQESKPLTRSPSTSTPSHPHLSNPQLASTMRPQIAQQSQQNPSFYSSLVGGVNSGLQRMGFGISQASHSSVMNNLAQVHNGTMSQGTAHFNEAMTFGQDALQSFKHGRPIAGGMESVGVVLNTIGGIGMSGLQGLGSKKFGSGASTGTINNFE